MEKYSGIWVSYENENFDELLKALGVGVIMRTAAKRVTTTLDIKYLGEGKFKVKSTTGPSSREVNYAVGEMIEDKNPGGGVMKGSWQISGEEMHGNFKSDAGMEIVIKRSITDDIMLQEMHIKNVKCKRFFKRK